MFSRETVKLALFAAVLLAAYFRSGVSSSDAAQTTVFSEFSV